MPTTTPFHSVNEALKPIPNRVFHNNSACAPGRDIPQHERRPGTASYRLCDECQRMNTLRL